MRVIGAARLLDGMQEFAPRELEARTVKELKELLRARRLPQSGRKAELIQRLIEACTELDGHDAPERPRADSNPPRSGSADDAQPAQAGTADRDAPPVERDDNDAATPMQDDAVPQRASPRGLPRPPGTACSDGSPVAAESTDSGAVGRRAGRSPDAAGRRALDGTDRDAVEPNEPRAELQSEAREADARESPTPPASPPRAVESPTPLASPPAAVDTQPERSDEDADTPARVRSPRSPRPAPKAPSPSRPRSHKPGARSRPNRIEFPDSKPPAAAPSVGPGGVRGGSSSSLEPAPSLPGPPPPQLSLGRVQSSELGAPLPSGSLAAASDPEPSATGSKRKRAPIVFTEPAVTSEAAPNARQEKLEVEVPGPDGPTRALRIDGLRRPLKERELRDILEEHGQLEDFWLDNLKSHCYVLYKSVPAAQEALAAVDGREWPPRCKSFMKPQFVCLQEAAAVIRANGYATIKRTRTRQLSGGLPGPPDDGAAVVVSAAAAPEAPLGGPPGPPVRQRLLAGDRRRSSEPGGVVAAAEPAEPRQRQSAPLAIATGSAVGGQGGRQSREGSATGVRVGGLWRSGRREGDVPGGIRGGSLAEESAEEVPARRGLGGVRGESAVLRVEEGQAGGRPGGGAVIDLTDRTAEGKGDARRGEPALGVTVNVTELFRKTAAKPHIFWLPLTDEQVAEKGADAPAEVVHVEDV